MKKTHIGRTIWAAALLMCCIALFTTCKNSVGLGGTIDITPPKITVSSPPTAAVVRNSFTLQGSLEDDTGVKTVAVAFIDREGKPRAASAEIDNKAKTWKVCINRKDESGLFPLKDGQQTFTITAEDTSGKKDNTEIVLIIDNTPPFLVLDRPSTVLPPPPADTETTESVDTFGDRFLLIGQVSDTNGAAKLEITAWDPKDPSKKTNPKTFYNIPPTVDITVDTFSLQEGEEKSSKDSGFYRSIYGTNEEAGVKKFTYTLAVSDGAREYDSPDTNGAPEEGNKTDVYYLYDHLHKDVFKEGNNKMADIYAMLAGTYTGNLDAGRSAGSVENTEAVKQILDFLQNPEHSMGGSGDKAGKQGFFGLYPAKNPTFAIDGFKPMSSDTPAENYPKVYPDGIISIKLLRNRDKTPLKTDYITAYKIMLHEKEHPDNKHELSGFTFSMQDGVLTASGNVTGLPLGKVYILTVKGTDTGGNEFIPARSSNEAGHYAFYYVKTGRAPEIKAVAINDNQSANGVSERVYIKKGTALTFTAKLTEVEKAQLTYELSHNGTKKLFPPSSSPALEITNNGDKDYTIDADEFDQTNGGSYQLKLKARDPATGQSSVEQTYHIYYDTKEPEVQIAYPLGNLHGTEGNGLVIKGTAFDTGSGLADTDPVTVSLTKQDETTPPTETVISTSFAENKKSEDWELQPITISEGKYTLTVTVKDKVGLEKTKPVNFIYDEAAPKIKDVKIDSKGAFPVVHKTGTFKVSGVIEESYGITSCTIGGESYTFAAGASSPYSFEKELTREEGTHNIEIKTIDKAGKGDSQTVQVIVDKTKPAFESIKIATTENVQNGNSITAHSSTVAIKGKIKETGSGIEKLEYQVEGDTDWTELNAVSKDDGYHFEGTATIGIGATKKLFLKVTDKAGWEALWECTVTVVRPEGITWALDILDGSTENDTVNKSTKLWYARGQFQVKIGGTVRSAPDTGSAMKVIITQKGKTDPIPPENFFEGWTVAKIFPNEQPVNYTVKAGLDDGDYTITLKDETESQSSSPLTFTIDKTVPTVSFDSPQNNQIVNKTITIRGTANDSNGLQSVKIVKDDGSDLTGVSSSSGANNNKAEFTGTKAYNWRFNLDTVQYCNSSGTGTLTLKAIVTDVAGNTTEKTLTLNLDQHSDRPQIVITNITALNATGTYLTTDTLNFVILDDDGEIEDGKFEITSDPANAGMLTKTVSGWQYTFAADGKKTLNFKVTDKQGGIFDTTATDSFDKLRLYPKDTNSTVSEAAVVLHVDTQPPQSETPAIQFTRKSDYSGLANLEQNAKFKNEMLYLQVMASDANGIGSITGKIDDVTSTLETQNVDHADIGRAEKWQIKLDLNSVAEGVKTLTIELKDKAGATSQFTRTITVDKTAPTITLNYPEPTDPQAGAITVSGTIFDAHAGVKAEKTKYILGKKTPAPNVDTPDYEATTAPQGWKAMDYSTKGAWNVQVNLDQVPQAEHGSAVGAYMEIPLYIFTEDEIGNKTVHEQKILFNPDGTKPVVKVLSPQADATVGGTIQIFGTANVVIGGAKDVGEVYIQFSRDGKFENATDGTFGGYTPAGSTTPIPEKDWYNSGNGQLIPGTSNPAGGADWRISINADGAFNHATDQKQPVYFRVRAKNKVNNRWGEWTEKMKIIVDKDAPLITGVQIDNALGTSSPQNYKMNMWLTSGKKLTATLQDASGIQDVKITFKNGNVEKKYQKKANSSDALDGGFTAVPAGWLTDYNSTKMSGYTLNLPLDLTGMSGDNFSVTIEIKEKSAQSLSSNSSFIFRFDTTDPIGDFGTDKYMNIGDFAASSITDAQLAQKVKDLGATESSGGSCKILADNYVLTVTKVTGDKIEFTASPALTAGSHSYILYKQETLIDENWIVNGLANDNGSGIAEVKAWVSVETAPATSTDPATVAKSPELVMKEISSSPINKITKQLGGMVTWQGKIDFSSVPDGKGKLHYTITDQSGNTYTAPALDVIVRKKPVTVSKVTLKTKIGGLEVETDKAGAAETDPKTTVTKKTDGKLNQTVTVESSNFTFKSKTDSKIKVEFTGTQQGSLKYRLKKGNNTIGNDLRSIPSDKEIVLTEDDLIEIGNSNGSTPTPITLEFWDQAYGFTQGTDSAWSKVNITTLFDALDTTPPEVIIRPFYWNSETDNSLYQNSRANGHIERKEDLPAQFTEGNTDKLMDKDDKVSGKISIRGTAHDDQVINEILGQITGFTFDGISGAESDKETKLTEYDFDSKKFKDIGTGTAAYNPNDMSKPQRSNYADDNQYKDALDAFLKKRTDFFNAKSWLFTITSSEFNVQTGHTLEWQLDWNSSKITDGVGTDKTIKLTVKDIGKKIPPATLPTPHVSSKTLQVDVVPYVTGVSRNSTYNTNRARSGAVPLLRGEADNMLTGFNFVAGSKTSLKITENKDGTGSSVAMGDLTLSSDKKRFTFKVPDTAKDGYLHLVVNGVVAVNNINAYTASNTEKSDTYGTEKHSDDRFVHIWRVNKEDTFKGSKNAIYPAMTKDSNGTLYASFSNYSNSSVYYSNEFTGNDEVIVAGNGTKRVFNIYDPPEETDITISETEVNVLYAANYHNGGGSDWGNGSSTWNDTSYGRAGGIYLYDKDASGTKYRFELYTYDNELQQFKNIRTLRSGNNIYVVYYDRVTGAVKFAWVDDSKKPNTNTNALPWCVIDGNTDITDTECKVPDAPTTAPPEQKTFKFVNPDGSNNEAKPYVLNVFEDGLSVSNAVWESIAVTVTTQGFPVVVYMDAATGSLRLARSTSKQPTSPADWTIQKVLDASDSNAKIASDYINACVGSDGVLHIAFQNTKGQLVYVKSTNTPSNGSEKYTFDTSEVLDDSGMSIDITMNGTTPYISYVSRPNSYDAIRIAYKTSMDFGNTGTDVEGWETMTAPLNQRAANGRICIETQAKHYNATEKLPVAVGFTTGSDYRAAFYVGK